MKNLSRVVWSEGMYLGPHHFQLQNRYFEDAIQFVTSQLWFESWGLAGAALDEEALRNGTLVLLHARGIFPDGLTFHMPECDPLPEARRVKDEFPPARDSALVMLAIPPLRVDGANCTSDASDTRYREETRMLRDETSGRDEQPVRLGRKNIRLLLDFEPAGDAVTLPVARVMRDGAGGFQVDSTYIPPCIDIVASERLREITKRLLGILEDKSNTLSAAKSQSGRSWADYATTDIARFWMLHSIHAAIPPVQHLLATRRGHPEELYRELARLAGALCTFAMEAHPEEVPRYDHRNLDECFGDLDKMIRRLLETILPTNCISIPLNKVKDYFWGAEIKDQRVLDRSRWVFAIESKAGEAEVIRRTPALVKICSVRFVEELVKRALPGLSLTHMQIPPSAIAVRADTQYFGVSRGGPCWDSIVQTRQVGLYVPGDLPEPRIELLVVLES